MLWLLVGRGDGGGLLTVGFHCRCCCWLRCPFTVAIGVHKCRRIIWGGKVRPCRKEILFNCIEEGTDAWAEGGSMEPLYKVFLHIGWYEGIGLWLWGVEW